MAEQKSVATAVADLRAAPDPAAELVNQALLNTPALVQERRVGADGRAGGDPAHAPRSLLAVELEPDDEAIASTEEWDDPERL